MELSEIIKKILTGEIECGSDKDYCFHLDEDGVIRFMKAGIPEDEDGWRWDWYDTAEVLWEMHGTYENRGLGVASSFLDALGIYYIE